MRIRQAIRAIFETVEIPTDRVAASRCYTFLNDISKVSKVGKSIASEQLEWLKDEIEQKAKAMQPDRYTDLSTPLMRDELNKLKHERKQAQALFDLVDELEVLASKKLPKKANALPSTSTFYENDYEGM
ncbi:hypothetical protein [Alteromonas sp. W364]|uniref:hypothetical protein n=1 Tax=Alteromonas sp. W364 TaxID=3075610 RepID=UPI002887A720|nr:hypothetical protein [Alteromonas sp. W364]MDT0626887.1 hypothetical protein [Alteromonas sp. W364]